MARLMQQLVQVCLNGHFDSAPRWLHFYVAVSNVFPPKIALKWKKEAGLSQVLGLGRQRCGEGFADWLRALPDCLLLLPLLLINLVIKLATNKNPP